MPVFILLIADQFGKYAVFLRIDSEPMHASFSRHFIGGVVAVGVVINGTAVPVTN